MPLLAIVLLMLASAGQATNSDPAARQVRALIEQGAEACAAGRPQEVLSHYAKDILIQYPGAPDQTFATMERAFGEMCRGSGAGTLERTVPTFEEVTTWGDIVMARVIWNTTIRTSDGVMSRSLRDLQLWRRTARGWEFFRGVHYPLKPSAPPAAK